MDYKIAIDAALCVSCGTCAEECQRHLPVRRAGEAAGDFKIDPWKRIL